MTFAKGQALGMLRRAANIRQDVRYRDRMKMAEKFQQARLDIARQDLGIRLQDAQRREFAAQEQQRIDAGLGQALQLGGYEAGIEFLKEHDPRRAIAFHSEKLKLDQQITKTDLMKNLAPIEKQKAMFEAYGHAGKISAGILNMAPEERGRAYKMMKPMFDKIAPGMPDKYGPDADTKMKLFMAQGTPANVLYATEKAERKAQTDIGKIYTDLRVARNRGNQAEINSLTSKLNAAEEKNKAAQMQGTLVKLQQVKTREQARIMSQKELDRMSKPFTERMEAYLPVIDTLKVLEQNPDNSNARAQLRYKVARMAERAGPLTESDMKATSGRAGYNNVSLAIKSWFQGKNVALNDMEMNQVRGMLRVYMDQANERQMQFENEYEAKTQFDMKNLMRPSEKYKNAWKSVQQQTQEYSQEDLEYTAKQHGMTVEEVKAQLQGRK